MQTFKAIKLESPLGVLTVIPSDNGALYKATDIATILGYTKPREAVGRYCKGATFIKVKTNGGLQFTKFIPYKDVLRLASKSPAPQAEVFMESMFDDLQEKDNEIAELRSQNLLMTDDLDYAVGSCIDFRKRTIKILKQVKGLLNSIKESEYELKG